MQAHYETSIKMSFVTVKFQFQELS